MHARDNLKEFFAEMEKKKREIDDLVRRKMPVHAGRIAVDHVQDNFRKGGFMNDGLQKWKKSNRELHGGSSAADSYRTLMSGRNHLYSSTKYILGDARVTIQNDVKYAGIHNFGGKINVNITPKMRKYFWWKYIQAAGIKKTKEGKTDWGTLHNIKTGENKSWRISQSNRSIGGKATMWKSLALTKKKTLNINMPQRQFIGYSKELHENLQNKLDQELEKIFNA